MNDYILSITQKSSALIITNSQGEQLSLTPFSLPSLPAAEIGRWLYQHIFSASILTSYQAQQPDRLLLSLPSELLDWPWQMLHDGFQPLALRHPIVLLPQEELNDPTPPLKLKGEPLRILLTLAPDEDHALLATALERLLDALAQQHPGQVIVRKERGALDVRRLLHIFRDTPKPFHLWQHVGPCDTDFSLTLAGATLDVSQLNYLLERQKGLRCFVLSTRQAAPAASLLSQLYASFLLCLSLPSSHTPASPLLQSFYDHLLTHDLAISATLAQIDTYLGTSESAYQPTLTMLARTPELHFGSPLPLASRRNQGTLQAPTHPVKMLFLKANPEHADRSRERLRIDQEMRAITWAMSENRRFFDRREEGALRSQDLSRYLLSHRPALLHFSGHGLPDGSLVLEKYAAVDESQAPTLLYAGLSAKPDPIPLEMMADVLVAYKETLHCVVLNACFSEALAEATCKHIDCAIGTRGTVNDLLAVRFSYGFYQALSYGDSVGQAFRKALDEVALQYRADLTQSFLLKRRPGVNPDDIFFVQIQGGRL